MKPRYTAPAFNIILSVEQIDFRPKKYFYAVKPHYNAPAFNIEPIEHTNFGPKKYFSNYLHVGNSKNLSLEHSFGQSLDMCYCGV